MKSLIPLSVLVLATPMAAQQQLAPYGQPKSLLPGAVTLTQTGNGHAASVTEGFEAYVVGFGSAENLASLVLDDTTITGTGQGPNLVEDGVTYSCTTNSLQWNGDTYFGLPSKTFLANTGDGTLSLAYDNGQSNIGFNLHTFDGFPDTATVRIYDTSGVLIFTSAPIAVPDSNPVAFAYSGANIGSVAISGAYGWSPTIDEHKYDANSFEISIFGNCGSTMDLRASGATPGGPVAVIYSFGLGSYVIPGGPCAGTVLGLDGAGITLAAVLTADAAGFASHSAFVPPGACGVVFVQGLDVATCATSNVVGL